MHTGSYLIHIITPYLESAHVVVASGFDSRRGLRFFRCSTLVTNWIFHLSHFFPSLKFTIFLSLLSHMVLSTLLILVVCRKRVTTNSVNMTSLATSLPVAKWLERPTGERKVMGLIPVGDSDFFFVPCSWQTEYSIFLKNHVVIQVVICKV